MTQTIIIVAIVIMFLFILALHSRMNLFREMMGKMLDGDKLLLKIMETKEERMQMEMELDKRYVKAFLRGLMDFLKIEVAGDEEEVKEEAEKVTFTHLKKK